MGAPLWQPPPERIVRRRDVVRGRAVRNREALASPETLELFRDLPERGR